jgi:hypothetical protein
MVTHPHGPPNPPERESDGQWGIPIAPRSVPSRTASRRYAKWFAGMAIAVLVVAGAAAGIVATNHTQHTGSTGPTVSSTRALQQWWAEAQQDFADMQNASKDVDQAFSRFMPGALAAACQHMHDAAEVGMQSHLPSPNPELTAELHAAVEDFHSAAHLCLAVVAGSPANYDGEFFSSMSEANRHMRAAQDIINKMLTNV